LWGSRSKLRIHYVLTRLLRCSILLPTICYLSIRLGSASQTIQEWNSANTRDKLKAFWIKMGHITKLRNELGIRQCKNIAWLLPSIIAKCGNMWRCLRMCTRLTCDCWSLEMISLFFLTFMISLAIERVHLF